ncbi:MAG: hypothetical protein QHH43_08190 [Candidatus Saccharicenans sp.]|nr:hypothetical protein [Candidatus Saccharicenans sp.]MDH7575719.1 hypothetical protein [Candidatus Saccharicenans sp.]
MPTLTASENGALLRSGRAQVFNQGLLLGGSLKFFNGGLQPAGREQEKAGHHQDQDDSQTG